MLVKRYASKPTSTRPSQRRQTLPSPPCSPSPSSLYVPELRVGRCRAEVAISNCLKGPHSLQHSSQHHESQRPDARAELTFRLVMTTLEGLIPTGTVAAFDFSTVTRSTWITHFLRYTCSGNQRLNR